MRRQLGVAAWRQSRQAAAEKALAASSNNLSIDQIRSFSDTDSSILEDPQSSGRTAYQKIGHLDHHSLAPRSKAFQPSRGFAASAIESSQYLVPGTPSMLEGSLLRSRYIPPGGFLALNNIRDNPGAKREKKRLGRGTGSGLGKTSGRGHKGQKARAGRKPRAGFEGGQTPLRLSIPKRGFHNPFMMDFQVLNLNRLHDYIERGKIDANNLITMKTLKDAGAIGKAMRDGVKLLGRGSDDFKLPIKIEVSRVSEQARKTIESAGGSVTTVHYNKLGLRALYKPEWFVKKGRMIPRPARPPPKLRGKVETMGRLPAPTTPLEVITLG